MMVDTTGDGPELSYQGKSYRLHEVTFEAQAAVKRRLERHASDAIEAQKAGMSGDWYTAQLRGWRADCAAGTYRYTGDVAREWCLSVEGLTFLAWQMLRHRQRDLEESFAGKWAADPVEGPKLLDAAFEVAFPLVARLLREAQQPLSSTTSPPPGSPANTASPTPTTS